MAETRKIAAILVADVVGYSRLAGVDEEGTLARLRALRRDLIDPAIAKHHGRIVKRTGDGSLIEFRSVVDAVRCAIEMQNGMVTRNAGLPSEQRIEFRLGIHLGDVVEEADGDLMGEGVNIAARLESIAKPGAICLSEDAYRQVKARLDLAVRDLGPTQLKNIAEPIRIYSLDGSQPAQAKPAPAPPAEKFAPPAAAFFAAEAKVTKALSSVPDHARAHMLLGYVEILTKRAAPGIAECEHALALDRNLAPAHAFIGLGKIYIGRAEETEAHIGEALRLSPRDTMAYDWMTVAGVAKNYLGLYDQAVPWFRRAIEANRNHPHPHFVLGVALALLGRLDEARSSVKAGLALNPTFTISRARAAWSAMSDDPTHLAQLERLLEGMRKAGAPEQ